MMRSKKDSRKPRNRGNWKTTHAWIFISKVAVVMSFGGYLGKVIACKFCPIIQAAGFNRVTVSGKSIGEHLI